MSRLYAVAGPILLALLFHLAGQAQVAVLPSDPTTPTRWTSHYSTQFRVGMQAIRLDEINQALQQAGYGTLPGQLTTFGVVTQRQGKRGWSFPYEFGGALNSPSTANGINQVKAGYFYFKYGFQYPVIQSERFQLSPLLSFQSAYYTMQITRLNNPTQTLASVLANPGNAQTAKLSTGVGGLDAGATATYQIPYGRPKVNCSTISQNMILVSLDAGYRLSNRAGLDRNHAVSAENPSVRFTGWYAGLRVGFGSRSGKAVSSPESWPLR